MCQSTGEKFMHNRRNRQKYRGDNFFQDELHGIQGTFPKRIRTVVQPDPKIARESSTFLAILKSNK